MVVVEVLDQTAEMLEREVEIRAIQVVKEQEALKLVVMEERDLVALATEVVALRLVVMQGQGIEVQVMQIMMEEEALKQAALKRAVVTLIRVGVPCREVELLVTQEEGGLRLAAMKGEDLIVPKKSVVAPELVVLEV